MEHLRPQARIAQRLKIIQQQVGHSWASTTATYTSVGADARNRMLRAALGRVYDGEGQRR